MTLRCGHPDTDENTVIAGGRAFCRVCKNERAARWWRKQTETRRNEAYRKRYLPAQLSAARHKVEMLEAEARRYGLTEMAEARR